MKAMSVQNPQLAAFKWKPWYFSLCKGIYCLVVWLSLIFFHLFETDECLDHIPNYYVDTVMYIDPIARKTFVMLHLNPGITSQKLPKHQTLMIVKTLYWHLNVYYELPLCSLNQNKLNFQKFQIVSLHSKLEFFPMLNYQISGTVLYSRHNLIPHWSFWEELSHMSF